MRALLLACCLAVTSCVTNHPFEICNGLDDDRDRETLDGLEDLRVGEPCDGPDDDLCAEGSQVCVNGQIACNDATGDAVEACNATDDDCDTTVDEGFDLATDPRNCGACDRACTNANGATECNAGACSPSCAMGAVDCNADPDDGCEVFRDRNPTCEELAGTDSLSGDSGGRVELTGTDEAIFEITLTETSMNDVSVTASIDLEVPPGLDYDLYVYCESCGGTIMSSSRNPAGTSERVDFRHLDSPNINDDQTIYVEVRFVSETACGDEWRLTITGATSVPNVTCGPV